MSSMRFTALSVCILVFVGLASADGNKRCMRLCPRILLPVCGQNSEGDHRTFPNECELNNYNCVHPEAEYELLHKGACRQQKRSEECPVVCPLLYRPVCGENPQGDSLTFDNDCERVMYNCRHPESSYTSVRPGTCEAHALDECPDVCPAIYKPLCARNPSGRRLTFANECALEVYNCQWKSDYERVSDGFCDESTEENCPICPKLLRPVCGENGDGGHQTFPNECELRRFNCRNTEPNYELLHEGRCTQQKRSEQHEECPEVCNFLYRPLCGSNPQGHHRTFGNECEMKKYNCGNPDSKYGYLHSGIC